LTQLISSLRRRMMTEGSMPVGGGYASSPHKRALPNVPAAGFGRPQPPTRGASYDAAYSRGHGGYSDGDDHYYRQDYAAGAGDSAAPPPPPREPYAGRRGPMRTSAVGGRGHGRGDHFGDSDMESVVSGTSAFSSQSAPHARMRRMG